MTKPDETFVVDAKYHYMLLFRELISKLKILCLKYKPGTEDIDELIKKFNNCAQPYRIDAIKDNNNDILYNKVMGIVDSLDASKDIFNICSTLDLIGKIQTALNEQYLQQHLEYQASAEENQAPTDYMKHQQITHGSQLPVQSIKFETKSNKTYTKNPKKEKPDYFKKNMQLIAKELEENIDAVNKSRQNHDSLTTHKLDKETLLNPPFFKEYLNKLFPGKLKAQSKPTNF